MTRRGRSRYLLPYNAFATGTATALNVTAQVLSIPTNRPSRPDSVVVRYAAAAPTGCRFTVIAGNGEEVYQSPALVAGPAPQVFRVRLPPNTDFSKYSNTQPVFTLAGNLVTWAIRVTMQHKDNLV